MNMIENMIEEAMNVTKFLDRLAALDREVPK